MAIDKKVEVQDDDEKQASPSSQKDHEREIQADSSLPSIHKERPMSTTPGLDTMAIDGQQSSIIVPSHLDADNQNRFEIDEIDTQKHGPNSFEGPTPYEMATIVPPGEDKVIQEDSNEETPKVGNGAITGEYGQTIVENQEQLIKSSEESSRQFGGQKSGSQLEDAAAVEQANRSSPYKASQEINPEDAKIAFYQQSPDVRGQGALDNHEMMNQQQQSVHGTPIQFGGPSYHDQSNQEEEVDVEAEEIARHPTNKKKAPKPEDSDDEFLD